MEERMAQADSQLARLRAVTLQTISTASPSCIPVFDACRMTGVSDSLVFGFGPR